MFKKLWQAVGRKVWVSEYKDSMMPRTTFRSPAPVSQPPYQSPVTAASDIYNNQYYKRDVRRNYPRTEVYTQTDVGTLLLGAKAVEALPESNGKEATADGAEVVDVPVVKVKDVVEALDRLQKPLYSASNLPPVPGIPYKYKLSPEQTHEGPGEYYPSYRVY
ncbi:hypothetical protein IW140_001768 [Coemansia sp. RSA 1813]|nr:hypothetical protein EV178_002981 [Coemansia sp. RSA 1646]KAJ1769186.1 hypothetical protein LPJ74_004247 [Coemansia sp. RSA 1843]KAJ2090860.1 hypothetical protein IW138_002263 [Coemansia sp. RSA 986]KAJ2213195.1 hypothetical protein EV179_004070 [Coemansia sp. RSA 487]KAJ2571313.1 hypothetical protein IW140_001768 [Coemansia sp. RSA 1813]